MDMAKANPKEAATHKAAISEIQAKIQELMDKLEMVEKSKKPIETEEEKKPLKENEGGDLETLKSLLDTHDWFYTFSDDPRVYSKGTQEIEQIRSMAKQLGDEGIKMYVMKFKEKFPNADTERLMKSMKGE
jgi:predicted peroxiredoxin